MLPDKKIMFIYGTRPEAIKVAPVISELKRYQDIFSTILVVTGQHREMLSQVNRLFDIIPNYDLEIMEKGQTLTDIISKSLRGLEEILLREHPDIILIQGDTSTVFAAALSAFFHHIPVGHIEAGLRTHNKYNPFPEEMNRRMVSAATDIHFAPTQTAVQNLKSENVDPISIYLTGNTVIDALISVASRPFNIEKIGIKRNRSKKLVLVTAHRRESFGLPLRNICEAIQKIVERNDDVEVILPVHKNPMVSETVYHILGQRPNIHLIEPQDYEPFVHLMKEAYLILTDSGGVQEEAPSLGKPVLVLRETTERPEAIAANTVKLIGTNETAIIRETELLLKNASEYEKMKKAVNPYGDGQASKRIAGALLHFFGLIDKRPEEFEVGKHLREKILSA